MKERAGLHLTLSIIVSVLLIACGTSFATGYSGEPLSWLSAHKLPLVWLIDFSAIYTLFMMATLLRAHQTEKRLSEEMYILREEHHKQLESVVVQASETEEHNTELLDINSELQEKANAIESQKQEIEQRLHEMASQNQLQQRFHNAEINWLSEQTFKAMQSQVEAHARQLEAVNLALQYHRAEMSQLRHAVRTVAPESTLEMMSAPPLDIAGLVASKPSQ